MKKIDLAAIPDTVKATLIPFSSGFGGKFTLTYELRSHRPTDAMKAGLDQAVELGVISVEPFNDFGGLVYKPLQDCNPIRDWANENRSRLKSGGDLHILMTQPFENEDEMVDWMSPFGQGVYGKERQGKKPKDNPYPAGSDAHKTWLKGYRAGHR